MKFIDMSAIPGYLQASADRRVIDVFEAQRVQLATWADARRRGGEYGWGANLAFRPTTALKHIGAPKTVPVPLTMRERSP